MKKTFWLLTVSALMAIIWSCNIAGAVSADELTQPVLEEIQALSGGIRISWSDDEYSDRTAVYRKESGTGKFTRIAVVKKDYYFDEAAETGVEYIYCVKSFAGKGSRKVSSVSSDKGYGITYKPGKVTEVTGTHSGAENYVFLQWETVDGADKYLVYRSKTKGGKYKKIASVKGNFFEDTDVENGRYYYYRTRTVNTQSGKNIFGSYSSKVKVGSYGKDNYAECEIRVYALKNVKIKRSAASSAKTVSTLQKGRSILKIGEGDNGWSKVLYKDKTRYIRSKYLTEEKITVYNESTGRIIVDPEQEMWNLVVVNHSREMPEGYKPVLDEIFDTGHYLDERVTPYYEEMYKAAKKDGLTLKPRSAYRTYEKQKKNFNVLVGDYMSDYNLSRAEAEKKAATTILPPGTSEHNLGIAIDINSLSGTFAYSKEYKWLKKNAHKYGFILRYTEEKSDITGIIPEPWHWRFVGVEYAKEIKELGLCLEEYLEMKGIAF